MFIVPERYHLGHGHADVARVGHAAGEGAGYIERLADACVEAQADAQRAVGLDDREEDPQSVDLDRDVLPSVDDDHFLQLVERVPDFAPVEHRPTGDVAGQLRGQDQLPEGDARPVCG